MSTTGAGTVVERRDANEVPERGDRVWSRARALGVWWVLGAFAVSRAAAFAAGVRFDASDLQTAWQFIDLDLLRDRLLESVYYSHTEPPLFNLFIGLVVGHSPLPAHVTFAGCFLVMGVVFAVALLDLARSIGISRTPAIVVTVLVVCSPAAILYENWLFFTYPATVLLTVSAAAFARWVRSGRLGWLATLTVSTAACILTVALVHPLWYLVVVAMALLARRPRARRAITLAAVAVVLPLVAVGGVVVKNQVLFGVPGMSSWFGMNLARTTIMQLDNTQLAEGVASGEIDPVAKVLPFQGLEKYDGLVEPCVRAHPDVPVLSRPTKVDGGGLNFNDECYLPISRAFQVASVQAARAHPKVVARTKVEAWQIAMMPSALYQSLAPAFPPVPPATEPRVTGNRGEILPYQQIFDRVTLLTIDRPALAYTPRYMEPLFFGQYPFSLTIAGGFVLVVVSGVWAALRWVRRGVTPTRATLVLIALATLSVFVVGNTFEVGENNRFRWMVEPLMWIVIARSIEWAWRRSRFGGPSAADIRSRN